MCCCFARLRQELELKSHALALLEERERGSESAQIAAAVAAAEGNLAEAEQAAKDAKQKKADMVAKQKVSKKAHNVDHDQHLGL